MGDVNKVLKLCFFLFSLVTLSSFVSADFHVGPNYFAQESIKEKALDVSSEIELYLKLNPNSTLEDLKNNPEFQELAIQDVGETGYTYLIVYETGILEFHPDPDIRDGSYNAFKDEFPVIWDIIDEVVSTTPCQDSEGFYDWRDIDDLIREKYTYHSCIDAKTADGYSFFVGSSTYLDEYDEPKDMDVIFIILVGLVVFGGLAILSFSRLKKSNGEGTAKLEFKKFLFGKISRRVGIIIGIIILTVVIMGTLIIYFQDQVLEDQFTDAILENEEDFVDIEQESIRTLSAALEVILQDPGLKEVYLEKNRERLYQYGQPLFKELKENYQITHFYFHLPDGHNFVRIHNREKFGDLIQRATFLEAKSTKEIGIGIELGQTAYALRVVKPYYDGNELIGYVELGQEIDEFLDIMKKGKTNEFSLVVQKESLNEEGWRSVIESKGSRDNWDDFEDYVVISSTTEEVFSCFKDENVELLREDTLFVERSNVDDYIFACGGFAIVDAFDDKSGVMFSLIDVTEEQNLMYGIRYILLAILSVIVIIFVGIGFYVTNKITRPILELDVAAKEIKKRNFKVKTNIKTGDELELLGNSINETVKALDRMDTEHKQLEKAKTEFISITSHELRSPMTPMKAQLQMLERGYFGKLNEKQKNALDIVLRNTSRLDNIIVDFLEVSRIEAARLKFKFVKADLKKHTKRLVEEMKGFMPEKKIKIRLRLGDVPIISVDPDRTMQVLRNLVNNAIKFSPEGNEVVIDVVQKGNYINFSVKDSGIGISLKDQEKIFEPFYQAEQTMYREHGGTGLGLAICRGIVESQNGRIWIESKKGKGTKFYFTIPLRPVKKIRPIKLLFSQKENVEKEIKVLFREFLGPIGEEEYMDLEKQKGLTEKNVIGYAKYLNKKGIIKNNIFEEFKKRISHVYKMANGGIKK